MARPFADFLVGRSVVPVILEEILAVVETDAAVEQVLTFRAIYSGPEEVLVMAKIHPAAHINSEQFSRAMDNLDHKIRLAFPFVADVFIDVTANHIQEALDPNKRGIVGSAHPRLKVRQRRPVQMDVDEKITCSWSTIFRQRASIGELGR